MPPIQPPASSADVQALSQEVHNLSETLKDTHDGFWNKLAGPLIGFVAAAAGFLGKVGWDYYRRPILALEAVPKQGSIVDIKDGTRYARIIVRNTGYRIARKVRLVLTDIRKISGAGHYEKLDFNEAKTLQWAYKEGPEKDIANGPNYFVDVCKSKEGQSPPVELIMKDQAERHGGILSEKGEYLLVVYGTGDDVEPVKASFKIVRNGDLNKLDISKWDKFPSD